MSNSQFPILEAWYTHVFFLLQGGQERTQATSSVSNKWQENWDTAICKHTNQSCAGKVTFFSDDNWNACTQNACAPRLL